MWKHRNDTLFNNQVAGVSYKRRKTILRAVRTQLKIGFKYVRAKDSRLLCTDFGTLKKWTTPMLEAWLKHIITIRKRAHKFSLVEVTDGGPSKDDDIYIERYENLKRFSTPKFTRWRLKHHESTLVHYVHSTEELRRQLKKRRRTHPPR